MSQLPGVTSNDALVRLVVFSIWSDLVQDGNDEYCSLAHARLGLTENVLALKGLWDGINLNLAGMLEAALSDGSFQLVSEEKFVPSGEVGTCVFLFINSWLLVVRTAIIWK